MINVHEIMSEDVLTLQPNNSLLEARMLMSQNNIRHLPIVDDEQKLTGIISQRDVLAAEESAIELSPEIQRKTRENGVKIADFYKENVVSILPNASALSAARYMQKHKLGCLPVVKNNKLVGIITDSDFVNVAVNLMELLEEQESTV